MRALIDLLVAAAVPAVILIKSDPFHWFMPDAFQMLVLCLFTAALLVYAGLIFREAARDEREASHLYRASRWGYLVGVLALTVTIVVQDLLHCLDPWLLVILGLMVVVKLVVLRWSQWKH